MPGPAVFLSRELLSSRPSHLDGAQLVPGEGSTFPDLSSPFPATPWNSPYRMTFIPSPALPDTEGFNLVGLESLG